MADSRESQRHLLVLILFFILPSCAAMNKGPSTQKPVQAQAQAATSARQHMDAGEYQDAIDDYSAEYESHPENRALAQEYVKSLEDMKAAADKASAEEEFASAGRIYNVLLKNYSCFTGFVQTLSFDRADLNARLSHCRNSLSTQGFQEYRKGDLSGAIALWQSLLTIDPHNEDIKEAVRTATLQQKNLQEGTNRR